ncbi:hypothetical protein CLD22_10465 [Rubrivivax gelatinosus]|nr:hypothetical protein [Rubrivivax gelatinosus]
MSTSGFLRPQLRAELTAAEADAVEQVCPGVDVHHDAWRERAERHPIWGPVRSTHVGWARDEAMRRQGSSGGVISALADFLLRSGRVDFIAQNAARSNDPLGNEVQASRSREDVLHAAGSRYGPAAPLQRIGEFLASGQRFAFVGKPCDVAALRALARIDARVGRQVPYALSFMCAGVPSRAGTLAVLQRMGIDPGDLASFRYRGDGWPGSALALTRDGRSASMDYATSWGRILNRHLQFRCKICPDGTGEFADITCADAWYGKDGYPDFAERDGRSLVLARTDAGSSLLQLALAEGAVVLEPLDLSEVARMQPYQVTRKEMVLGRVLGARLALGRAPRFRNLGLLRASLAARPIPWLRSAVGTFRRAKGEAQ